MANQLFTAANLAKFQSRVSAQAGLTPQGNDVFVLDQADAALTIGAADVVFSPWIDLQKFPNVKHVRVAKVNGVASAGEILDVVFGIDGANALGSLPADGTLNTLATNSTSAIVMTYGPATPIARYIQLKYTNGATPQTTVKFAISLASD